MDENATPLRRSAVEAAAYQATKNIWSVSDTDLEAVVAGKPVDRVTPPAVRTDFAFPDPHALKDFI